MSSLKARLLQQSLGFWHVLTVVLAVIIAAQVQYIQHGWINNDTVLYLEAANFFARGDWQAGFAVFPWPFYSLCIWAVHQLTALDTMTAAQVLNVVFFGLATHAFMRILRLAGGKQAVLIAGCMLWLSAQYMIGGVLEMLMRDEGFWAFFMLSLVAMIRFMQTHALKHALCWQLCMMIATLFRVEGLFYLALLPLLCLWQTELTWSQRIGDCLRAHCLNLIACLSLAMVFLWHPSLSSKALGRLNEFLTTNLWSQFTEQLITHAQIMATAVLGDYLKEFAIPGLLLTFAMVIIVKTLSTTGWLTALLAWQGLRQRQRLMTPAAVNVLMASSGIALLTFALIIVKVFVLSGRYLMPLAMILMVFASFYFGRLLSRSQPASSRWQQIAILGMTMLCVLGSVKNILPKQAGYNYLQDAVRWVQQTSPQATVFYDDAKVKFYAKQPFTGTWPDPQAKLLAEIEQQTIQPYQYLVLTTDKQAWPSLQRILQRIPDYQEIKRFYDAKGKKWVLILQTSTPQARPSSNTG